MLNTIEDLLEFAAGLHKDSAIVLESKDSNIITSIARQVFKGTALTDRQLSLMQTKLKTYEEQFTILGHEFDNALGNLRQPLRNIDRSKYIKVVEFVDCVGQDKVFESYKSDYKWIKIRFPFSKKLITLLEGLSTNPKTYYHEKGSHEHSYALTESNIVKIYENFKDKEFDIDSVLVSAYNEIKKIEEQKDLYLTGFFDNQLKNLNKDAKELALKEIGPCTKDNIIQYVDRKLRYGIDYIPENISSSLDKKYIVNRSECEVLAAPSKITLETLLMDIHELDRYPLLVVLSSKAETELYQCYQFFRDIISSEQQSVLFREEGETEFNNLVKQYKLNNWVDKNTKVVYININKLPKVLFKSNFNPIAAIAFESRMNRNVDNYILSNCDLIVFREEELSPIRRYSRFYGRL